MRARYSAYVMCDESFLLESWHVDTRPPAVVFDPDISWHGLTVIDTESGGVFDAAGEVAFIARFDRGGEPLQLEERSSFVRVESRWMYVTGE